MIMASFKDMSKEELLKVRDQLQAEYEGYKAQNLKRAMYEIFEADIGNLARSCGIG